MIKLTKIDEHIEVYRDKKVVIWGTGDFGRKLYHVFEYFKVDVIAFCDNNEQKWGSKVNGICIISPSELKEKLSKYDTIVIRIAMHPGNQYTLMPQINELGLSGKLYFDKIDLLSEEFDIISQCIIKIKNIKQNPDIMDLYNDDAHIKEIESGIFNYISKFIEDELICICTPSKTGDVTLMETFNNNNIKYINMWHNPENLKFCNKFNKKIKIITGIREPMGKYLSGRYQALSTINSYYINDLIMEKINQNIKIESVISDILDIQYIFDKGIDFILNDKRNINDKDILPISRFINDLKNFIGIDIMSEPFNKEKGYVIIKKDNIEIFVYQLEKMNDIVGQMSEFIGENFDKWEIANVADDKWISDSYNQAKKEIKVPKNFYDICYKDSYIQHFYSEDDVERFKNNWRSNIKNDDN